MMKGRQAEKCHIAGGSVAWGGLFATFPLGTVHRQGNGREWGCEKDGIIAFLLHSVTYCYIVFHSGYIVYPPGN